MLSLLWDPPKLGRAVGVHNDSVIIRKGPHKCPSHGTSGTHQETEGPLPTARKTGILMSRWKPMTADDPASSF